jgi:hypothetical protein
MRILDCWIDGKLPLISFFSLILLFVFCCFAQTGDVNMTDINTTNVGIADVNAEDVNTIDVDTADINTADVNTADVNTTSVGVTDEKRTIGSVETAGNVYISSEKILSTARSRAGAD